MEPALTALQQLLGIPVKTGNFLANAKNAVTGLLSPQSQVNIYRDPIHENIKIDEQGNQTSTFEKPVASYNDPWYDPKKDPNNMKLKESSDYSPVGGVPDARARAPAGHQALFPANGGTLAPEGDRR